MNGVIRTMTPGQNGPEWWRRAIQHNPAVCQAFDVWATHPYPESYPPHYNHHDGVPFINQVKTIDSYLLDLDLVASECSAQGSPRRGFPVMITETVYGDRLVIAYEGYPKATRRLPEDDPWSRLHHRRSMRVRTRLGVQRRRFHGVLAQVAGDPRGAPVHSEQLVVGPFRFRESRQWISLRRSPAGLVSFRGHLGRDTLATEL